MALVNLRYTPPSPLDLTVHDSGDTSPEEDFIIFWFRIQPNHTGINLTVQFNSGTISDNNRAFFRAEVTSSPNPANTLGLASLLEVKNSQGELLNRTDFVGESDKNNLLQAISAKTWIALTDDAQYMAIPKKLFQTQNSFDFSDVTLVSFRFENVYDRRSICIGDVQLVGGGKDDSGGGDADNTRGGMQGTYRYRVTFRNTTTGNRSNPGTVTQLAKDVNRGYVALDSIPVSADAQVDAREIWRTMGDGTRFFKIDQINDNVTTTYDDQVADFAGLDARPGIKVMSTEELPLDNDVPDSSFDHHIIDKLTAFWISSTASKSGRVYYSPIGRPESQKGFFDVSGAGDSLQRLVVFNGVRYVFSESKLYRIAGDDPYIAHELAGIPGVSFANRRTVASTPYGIMWQAHDGIRLYTGAQCALIGFDPIGKLFRGESAENLTAFEGTVATFARGEYYISDGAQCLALEVQTKSWRHVGFNDITSLFYEWDDDVLQGGRTSQVELLEEEGTVDDDGNGIAISWETSTTGTDQEGIIFVERVFIDADTNGETLTPVLVHRYAADTLATISNSSRSSFEREIQELLLEPGIRLTGTVSDRVTVYNIELEYRQVVLGINIEGSDNRIAIQGRWREDLGANGSIVFEIDGETKVLDQTDQVFVLDRLTIEADTEGTTVTPSIQLENNTVNLSALSTATSRVVNSYQIDRIGALNQVALAGPFFTASTRPKIYRVEAHMRELKMGLNVTTTGQRGEVAARCPDPDTAMVFEVQPIQQMFNNLGSLYFIERIVLETDTNGATLTPTIKIGGGSVSLAGFSTTARGYTEIEVERIGPIENLTLAGDFTGDVQIFGVEMFVRPVNLGIRMPDGNRAEIDGKAIAAGTKIVFDIDPADRRFDALSSVPLLERLFLDYDSASIDITPTIIMENQTIALNGISSSARDTVDYDINYIGRLRQVELAADFVTNAIKFYGAEIQMRPMPLGVNVISND